MIESMEDFTDYLREASDDELEELLGDFQTLNYLLEKELQIPTIQGHARKYVGKKSS
jgi:hypothetical protein